MAYTTINKSTDYFNTKLYTGTGSSNAITGVGFQPDLVWIKNRATTGNHALFNAISGVTKYVNSNTNYSEQTSAPTLTAFGTDGFTVGSSSDLNGNGNNIVSWNWKANGAGSANTDGSINSTVSANTTAGFSIVSYTGTGANATVGHGLGAAPKMIIFKNTNSTRDWAVYHSGMNDPDAYLALNQNYAKEASYNFSNNTAPTSSVFSVGTLNGNNGSSQEYIAYCFAEKPGYSKSGSYTGNGNADGTFVYTGFKPSLIIIKDTENAGENWFIFDSKRPGYNFNANLLNPNSSTTETTSGANGIDIISNGFKARSTNNGTNRSGANFIYMAFGQSLVGSNNVPCTAR